MRPLLGIAALTVLGGVAAAQDVAEQKAAAFQAQVDFDRILQGAKVVRIEAGIMGPAVKGQPYSAEEIHETNQVLADGTKIHTETRTTVARDSVGRVRRESPGEIMIWDSAAGTSYVLNQSNQTGQKMQVKMMHRDTTSPDGPPEPPGLPVIRMDGGPAGAAAMHTIIVRKMDMQSSAEGKGMVAAAVSASTKKETLNSQLIEGVNCEGVRTTSTLEAGAIGNDRPIQTVEERWYSPELQVNLLVRKTDPRIGEDTVRLTNVRRVEPDPNLFVVPSGYQIK